MSANVTIESEGPRVQSLLFSPLRADGANYLEWNVDVKTQLCAKELHVVLKRCVAGKPALRAATKKKALSIIRRHLHPSLGRQYVEIKNPIELSQQLKARFQHEKTIYLMQARNE